MKIISLYELNQLIRAVLEGSFPETFLITAEIASCDVKNHCYLSLVDKENDAIRAEIKAVIWADKYKKLSAVFTQATGVELTKGIKILFEASVSFHERYGLKLNIVNIDPSYTIGEMAVKRKEILERLVKEGLKDRNKELEFPLVPQKIGIISSSTAAGYEDLMTHLANNSYGYKFTCRLYEALMQGDRAEESVVSALQKCMADAARLDVVVIVRGGGGQADLQCFDSYEIAKSIAFMPVPVIAGIGHERDITVVDEVSNMRAKTPTAVADLIITRVKDFEDRLDSLTHNLVHGTQRLTSDERERISALAKNLEAAVRKEQLDNAYRLGIFIKGLKYSLKLIQSEKERLRSREGNVGHLNPANVLKRGYSITYHNGKAISSSAEAEAGDILRTVLHKGELTSTVEKQSRRKTHG
ncbi:MAG: exodeoxyribonuclease VII large subunit [Thermodesulfovibrionia bacterium]|nr:exodeoxyribonuclease VII large subunit [Thermodesulfovibrionia bacterium]